MDDVSNATFKIAKDGILGETYHISTKNTISIRNLVYKICNITKVNFNDLVNDSKDRLGKDQAYLLDSIKLRGELKWVDKISIDEGLEETLNWVDSNMEIIKDLPSNYKHQK